MKSLLPDTASARRDLASATAATLVVLVLAALFHPYKAWINWVAAPATSPVAGTALTELPTGLAFGGLAFAWYALRRRRQDSRAQPMVGGVPKRGQERGEEEHAQLERNRHASSVELLGKLAAAANGCTDAREAMRVCLDEVCTFTGWPLGHAYVVADDESGRLEPTGLWYPGDPVRFQSFRRVTEETSFAPGVGLPGRVLASGSPAWIVDVTRDQNFPRAKAVEDIGLKAALAFPVLIGQDVAAVLEFFCEEAAAPDEALLEIMAHAGTQLGRAIERERAGEALKQSEARCAGIIEIADDAIISIDRNRRIQLFNDGAETIFGYAAHEVLGQPVEVLLPKRFRSAHPGQILAFASSPDVSRKMANRNELVGLRKDGSEFPATASISKLGAGPDQIFTVILQDLTDLKRAEQALKENESHLRQAARTARLAHWIWDNAADRFDRCSEDLAWLFGYALDDFLVRFDSAAGILAQVHPDDRGSYGDEAKACLRAGRPYDLEFRARVADGSYRWFREISEPVCDKEGRRTHSYGVIQDITERKRAEDAVQQSEQRLKDAIESLSESFSLFDADDRLVLCNSRYLSLLYPGLEDTVVPGASFESIIRAAVSRDLIADVGDDVEGWIAARMARHRDPSGSILRRRSSGHWFHIDERKTACGGIVAIYTDVTEHKRTEQALRVSEGTLRDQVAQLESARSQLEQQGAELIRFADELMLARDQAEDANRAKTAFLTNMSHELRTPLNAIIGFSEIIKSELLGPVGSAEYRSYADDIHESGCHLLALINDILDLSKIEFGAVEVHEQRIDVTELVGSVLKLVKTRAEACDVDLQPDLGADLPCLLADERKLKQVLANLIANAIKFSETGGRVVLKACCEADGTFAFQVVDQGIGIAAKDIPKALSRFGQVDSNLNRKHEGTGLGLPLSKALVELHGGSFELESELGVGTRVTVRLPAERVLPSAGPMPDALDLAAG